MSEFSLLCRDRDYAAYGVVGAALVSVGFLNLNEVPKALKTLLAALEEFAATDQKITEYHQSQSSTKENNHVSESASQSNAA